MLLNKNSYALKDTSLFAIEIFARPSDTEALLKLIGYAW